jgi:hypothetical protein
VESCAPLSYVKLGHTGNELRIPSSIKNKLNVRKRLLKLDRERSVTVNAPHIRTLNKEINSYFGNARADRVRLAAMGSKVNLWKAVKVAKNLNLDSIPSNLTLSGVPIAEGTAAESFGKYFSSKIAANVAKARVGEIGVYNGKCKLLVQNRNFMMGHDVRTCMADLKNKRSEGFDRIPVCCILDARESLLTQMSLLFEKIYATGKIPEQWKCQKSFRPIKRAAKLKLKIIGQ